MPSNVKVILNGLKETFLFHSFNSLHLAFWPKVFQRYDTKIPSENMTNSLQKYSNIDDFISKLQNIIERCYFVLFDFSERGQNLQIWE